MENDKISVIVPVYNVVQYLEMCVISVQEQTYNNLEILLIDDGSNDGSSELCDKLAISDSRMKVKHQKNAGLSAARNTGINLSTGQYIFFVDSDDCLKLTALEMMYSTAQKNNADIVESGYRKFVNDAEIKNQMINKTELTRVRQFSSRSDVIQTVLNYDYSIMAWGKLYKKSLWNDVRFPVGKIHEDEAVIPYIFEKCAILVEIQDKLYFYRQREGSIIHSVINRNSLFLVFIHAKRKIHFSKYMDERLNSILDYHYFNAVCLITKGYKEGIGKKNLVRLKHLLFCSIISNSNQSISNKMKCLLKML